MRHLVFLAFRALVGSLLLADLVHCQFEDDALLEMDKISSTSSVNGGSNSVSNNSSNYPGNSSAALNDKDEKLTATFVSPVERFMRTLIKPLLWVASIGNNGNQNKPTNKIISGLTKPIRVAGKTIRGSFGQVLDLIGSKIKAIYPGTEWCGAGNISSSIENVGLFKKTDSCCREHDLCNVNMEAGESQHGLLNSGTFTRSHCACDSKFYKCLKKVRSLVSANIGYTYFNFLRPQCFKEDYPSKCAKFGRNRITYNKCVDYKYDTTKNKTWQWFDNPDY